MADAVPEPASASSADVLAAVSSRLNKIGAIVTTLVALSSALFACSADNMKRNDAFLAAVQSQERQWQELYDQYFDALAAHADKKNDILLDNRLLAICYFANREVPRFDEHKLGLFWLFDQNDRQMRANEQLSKLKEGLRSALQADGSSTEASSECVQRQDEVQADKSEVRKRTGSTPEQNAAPEVIDSQQSIATVAQANTAKIQENYKAGQPIRRTLTLATGVETGYDIDIFWCEGPDDADIWRRAKRIADKTATDSTAQSKLDGGFPIGRVRLRPLSVPKQNSPSYPDSGFLVSGDRTEIDIGNSLTKQFNMYTSGFPPEDGFGTFRFRQTSNDTKWYLSAFVCS